MHTTRFAPSPTGRLHLGNIRTALFNWLAARQTGGAMHLRLEDTDRTRHDESAAAAIAQDLDWLGLNYAGDPQGAPWRQSHRTNRYHHHFARLQKADAVYPCFCTPAQLTAQRAAQRAAGAPPRYDGTCARLSPASAAQKTAAGAPAAWRFRVPPSPPVTVPDIVRGPTQFTAADLSDFIIRRADGAYAFLFTNAVDDADMGITLALRGEDHVANTPRQLLILGALALSPPRYGHLPLIVGADGKPLSKRDGLAPIAEWRARGYLPLALTNHLARLGCTYPTDALLTPDALATHFNLKNLGRAPAQHDPTQLTRRQKEATQAQSPTAYLAHITTILGPQALTPLPNPQAFQRLTQPNVTLPTDAAEWIPILTAPHLPTVTRAAKTLITATAASHPAFYPAAAATATAPSWQELCTAVTQKTHQKGKNLYLPLRAALTGRTDGPAMQDIYPNIPPPHRQTRLAAAATATSPPHTPA